MVQSWPSFDGGEALATAILTKIENRLSSLRSLFSGGSEPSSPVAYQLWADTANNVLKMRNGVNSAWVTVGALNNPNHLVLPQVRLGDISSAGDHFILQVPGDLSVEDILLASSAGVTANDSNYWSFQVRNLTQSLDLLSSPQTTQATGGTAITADTPYSITPDQNADVANGDLLELQISSTGSPGALAGVLISVKAKVKGA